jgi:hypothetical protein
MFIEVLKQIEVMLSDLRDKDKRTYDIVLDLLKLVFVEYNTGKNQQIEKKLYDMIDAEINYKLKK